MIVTTLAVLCLVALPEFFFRMIFGREFGEIRIVIAFLGFGIIALSFSMILSQFFSGINKPYHNTISSAIGLVFTVLLGLVLIPKYGIMGAGISATVSYTFQTLYQFIIFSRMTKLKLRDFMLTGTEIRLLISELKKISPQ